MAASEKFPGWECADNGYLEMWRDFEGVGRVRINWSPLEGRWKAKVNGWEVVYRSSATALSSLYPNPLADVVENVNNVMGEYQAATDRARTEFG